MKHNARRESAEIVSPGVRRRETRYRLNGEIKRPEMYGEGIDASGEKSCLRHCRSLACSAANDREPAF